MGPGPGSQGHHKLRKDQTQGLHHSIKVLLKGIILSLFSCSEVLRAANPAERDHKFCWGPVVLAVSRTHVATGKVI